MSEAHELGGARGASRIHVTPERVSQVVAEVAREKRLHPGDIRSPTRRAHIVLARKEAMRRLAQPNVSIASIARAWPCDRVTVHHHLGRIDKGIKRCR